MHETIHEAIQETSDPLGYDTPLPLAARFYPLGFPLNIETNSAEILTLARSLWSRWSPRDAARAARLRIAVDNDVSRFPLAPAVPRGQGHLVSMIQAPDNFAIADLTTSFGFARLTRDIVANGEYVRYHFLEPLVYLMIDAAHLSPLHASCVALNGQAVVLCGDSGAGKTCLAYACARRGWTYLSDDATHIIRSRSGPWVAGRPYSIRFRESARGLFPELREFEPKLRPNGKLDIEVDTRRLNLCVAPESIASHIVFLQRGPDGTGPDLEPYPAPEASRRLRQLVCYGDQRIRSEQRQALEGLLRLPIGKLTYRDPSAAEEALRDLVISGSTAA